MKHNVDWIEEGDDGSHPVRVRGLKLAGQKSQYESLASHPVRVRGLKHGQAIPERSVCRSHPVRVRGLKLLLPSN